MTNYFVKNGGNNGLSGTPVANAWETITYAMSQMIAYDTLTIAAGTYAESVSIIRGHHVCLYRIVLRKGIRNIANIS